MSAMLLASARARWKRVFSVREALARPLGALPVTDIRRGVSNHISVRVVHENVHPDLVRTQLEKYGEIIYFHMKPLVNSPRWLTVNVAYADTASAFAAVDDLEGSVFCGRRVVVQFPKYGHPIPPKPSLKTEPSEKKAKDKQKAKIAKNTPRELSESAGLDRPNAKEEEDGESSSDSSDSDSDGESDSSDSSDSDEEDEKKKEKS